MSGRRRCLGVGSSCLRPSPRCTEKMLGEALCGVAGIFLALAGTNIGRAEGEV